MSDKKKDLGNCQDDLHRYFEQTDCLIIAVTGPGNMEGLTPNVMQNVLWLIQDRLTDIKITADKIAEIARETV